EEPKKVIQALKDPSWIEAMQEELLQFKIQQVWTLVNLPLSKRAIGTKWVYRNKKDERGIVIRNKARLVVQGYTQKEGIDYDEMSSMGELTFFLGLQVTQKDDGIFISQDKPDIMFVVCACTRFQVTPKVSHLHAVKRIFRYLKDRKSTTEGCQFLGSRLISWQCRKQTIVATSTTKAEYVAAANLLTKAFDVSRFNFLIASIGLLNL
ncbi:uncharacterized mitochondrial protein-like protein, partial [Tanacetum coccineum]